MVYKKKQIIGLCIAVILSYGSCHATSDIAAVLDRIDRRTASKVLGWNPYYTLYVDEQPVENSDEYTIYCHGLGENQERFLRRKEYGLLAGKIIAFDFEDAVYDDRLDFTKTSFGQEHETQALLYLLKHLDDAGMLRFHLYGYSRGGAVVLNAIKQLICYIEHETLFKWLGISHKQALVILEKIKAGTVVLDCPLLDMRVIMKNKFFGIHGFMDVIVCTLGTRLKYAPWKDQGIKSATYCKHLDLALLIHFQNPDTIVTNACDTEFYDLIKGSRTQCVVGNNEGHFHTGKTLAPAIREFRKTYGGSYRA